MAESSAPSATTVDERLGQLARGLVTGDAFFALRAYRALYRMGPAVIPAIRDVAFRASFVTPHGPDDRGGDYMPSLCSIRVIWRNLGVRVPGMRALSALDAERTLYHEVGHHVHRHGFGQIPHQEKEADRYAAACFRRSHPFLSGVVGPLARRIAALASRVVGQER